MYQLGVTGHTIVREREAGRERGGGLYYNHRRRRERERERERERQTETETETETEKDRERQRDRDRERQRETETETQRQRQTDRDKELQVILQSHKVLTVITFTMSTKTILRLNTPIKDFQDEYTLSTSHKPVANTPSDTHLAKPQNYSSLRHPCTIAVCTHNVLPRPPLKPRVHFPLSAT